MHLHPANVRNRDRDRDTSPAVAVAPTITPLPHVYIRISAYLSDVGAIPDHGPIRRLSNNPTLKAHPAVVASSSHLHEPSEASQSEVLLFLFLPSLLAPSPSLVGLGASISHSLPVPLSAGTVGLGTYSLE